MTEAEEALRDLLRNEQTGHKFRRQHIIDNYIADFICIKEKLIIEVDGGYHSTSLQEEKDNERTERLNVLGYTVIRFTNEEILFTPDKVIEHILFTIKQKKTAL